MIQINDFYSCRVCVSGKIKQYHGPMRKHIGEEKAKTDTRGSTLTSAPVDYELVKKKLKKDLLPDDLSGPKNISDF